MARSPGTTCSGKPFDQKTVDEVWKKGQKINNNNKIRKDCCGTEMHYGDYGNTKSDYGWEIDHIKPVSAEGTDELYNLQPLQWKNNRCKGDMDPILWKMSLEQ